MDTSSQRKADLTRKVEDLRAQESTLKSRRQELQESLVRLEAQLADS